jgi:hypothetical protein
MVAYQNMKEAVIPDARYLLISFARVVMIAAILFICFAIAMTVGMVLAHTGFLGTCQDGTCELVAAVYVMPLGGLGLFILALVMWSIIVVRRGRPTDETGARK